MRIFLLLLAGIILLIASHEKMDFISKFKSSLSKENTPKIPEPDAAARVEERASVLKEYLAGKNYNQDYCFMVDMKLSSGKKRFFVYDLDQNKVLHAGLVAHGSGDNTLYTDNIKFSNVPGSYCTSLGKYRIGHSYDGRFGLAYKLYGLDSTNDKAFERFVVLHAHSCVPDAESEDGICRSLGCPTVSPAFLTTLQGYLDRSKKPVMLWIYN